MNQTLENEQEGCIWKSLVCKQQLTTDAIVLKQAHEEKHNVHICCVHYQKVSDLVPHHWLMKVLKIHKICPKIRNVLQLMMRTKWTNLWVNNKNAGTVIKKGIF
jgi:hypothetical protein